VIESFTEEAMHGESIRDIEARLEAIIKIVEDLETDIEENEARGNKIALLQEIQRAYGDLSLALKGRIAFAKEEATRCELARIERELCEASA
jgi:hypothetical protein